MTNSLKVEIDIKQVMSLIKDLPPAAMTRAWRRALRKTGVWVKGQTAKAVSKSVAIPQKVLRSRVYFFLRSRDSGKVWLGLNDVQAHRVGRSRSTRRGISVGRHRFDGAWTMTKAQPGGPIYQRVGKSRKPYRAVKIDWSGPGETAFRQAAQAAEERLLVILRQEVNYEIQKALGNAR